ncbi:MAG: ArnT family glycosyltransferase [Chloroflexia bacterium]
MKTQYIPLALLLAITAFGAALRFAGLPQQGLAFYDEGALHQEALFIHDLTQASERSARLKFSDVYRGTNLWTCSEQTTVLLNNLAGIPPYDAKPLHWGIVALGIAGFGNVDWVGPICMAVLGTATIPLVFLIGKTLSDVKTGLLAALCLALNPLHVFYSRTGLAEADSVFFLSLAVYLLIRGFSTSKRQRSIWLIGTGLSGAVAAGTNHRYLLLGYAVLLALLFWQNLRQKRTFRSFLGELAIMTGPYVGLLLGYEVPWYTLVLIFKRCRQALPFETYLEQLLSLYSSQFVPKGLRVSDFFTVIPMLWLLCGPFYLVLLLAATTWIVVTRARQQFAVIVMWLIIPMVWFSTYGLKLARYLSLTIPAGCLIVAFALASMPGILWTPVKLPLLARKAISLGVPGVWLILIVSGNLLQGVWQIRQETGYPSAFRLLGDNGAKHFSTQYYLSLTYLGRENTRMMPASLEELCDGYQEGYRYFLVDLQVYFDGYDRWPERLQVLQEVMSSIDPRWVFPNPIGGTPQYILEHNFDWAKSISFLHTSERYALLKEIRIYDLRDYFASESCNQSRAVRDIFPSHRTPSWSEAP